MTKEYLLNLFEYDRENGLLIWKNHWSRNKSIFLGKIVGRLSSRGYKETKIAGKHYNVHRLIWFIETGRWVEQIDHINGNKLDNRFENLREISNRLNQHNQWKHRRGKLVGCYWNKEHQRWRAQIKIEGKVVYLGHFDSEIEAHQKYMQTLKDRSL